MMVLEILKSYGWVISIGLQVFVSFFLLWLRDKFAPKKLVTDVEDLKDDLSDFSHQNDKRLSKLETVVKDLPSTAELHDLRLQMCTLVGELKRVDQQLDGFQDLMKRNEKQLSLIDQALRSKA